MTPVEAANRLSIDLNYLYRLLRQGVVKGRKKGRQWIVDVRSVEDRLRRVA